MEYAFEPVIICFCCQWCSYAAADLAGSMRLQYPTNVKIIKVPCTGRVDVISLLKGLEEGADGVFVSGCLLGDCHYISGNQRATKRVAHAQKLAETFGLNPERVEMFYNSSAMGPQFAQCCRDFTDRIRKLGPSFKKMAPDTCAASAAPDTVCPGHPEKLKLSTDLTARGSIHP